jgi:F-type H+-transporting ATPase subunit a
VEKTPEKKGWRWGFNRWLVLLFMIGSGVAASYYAPVRPHVQLPAENVSHAPLFGSIYLTNTLIATLIADVLLIWMAFSFYKATKGGKSLIPEGFSGAVEGLLEIIYNLTEGTAGKWTRYIFPWFATITLLVLTVNWMELIPGVDSIGIIHEAEGHGYAIKDLGWATTLVNEEVEHGGYGLIPFVRVASTDLNFTTALALIAVVMVQVVGVKAQGAAYFKKFWFTETMFSKPMLGVIDFGVGILELISEFSKILSFAFRLFGNVFAGSVLLFVIGSLVPIFAQSMFLLLEFFVGLIQAFVFGLLTMTFMAQATQGHGSEHEEAHA